MLVISDTTCSIVSWCFNYCSLIFMNDAFMGEIGMEPIGLIGVAGIEPVAEIMEDVIFMLLGLVF